VANRSKVVLAIEQRLPASLLRSKTILKLALSASMGKLTSCTDVREESRDDSVLKQSRGGLRREIGIQEKDPSSIRTVRLSAVITSLLQLSRDAAAAGKKRFARSEYTYGESPSSREGGSRFRRWIRGNERRQHPQSSEADSPCKQRPSARQD